MSKEWIDSSLVEPTELEGVISGRVGSNVFFCSYVKHIGWRWIVPAASSEEIAEPEKLFLEPSWAKAHPRKSPVPLREKRLRIRKQKAEQLRLL
jgi:hypothetical protein